MNAAEESFGEIFQPFFDESIITAKILDKSPKTIPGGRGGETETGARIYKTGEGGDSLGSKFQKSFIHVFRRHDTRCFTFPCTNRCRSSMTLKWVDFFVE